MTEKALTGRESIRSLSFPEKMKPEAAWMVMTTDKPQPRIAISGIR